MVVVLEDRVVLTFSSVIIDPFVVKVEMVIKVVFDLIFLLFSTSTDFTISNDSDFVVGVYSSVQREKGSN